LSTKTLVVLGAVAGFLVFLGLLVHLGAEPCKDCHVPPPFPLSQALIFNQQINLAVNLPVVALESKPCVAVWVPVADLKVSFGMSPDCRPIVCLDGTESRTKANECGVPSREQTRIVKWRFEVFKRGEVVSVSGGEDARVDSRYNFFLDTVSKEQLKFVLTVTASDGKTASDEWVGGEYRDS